MTLQRKSIATTIITLLGLVAGLMYITSRILMHGFAVVERQATERDVARANDAIASDIAKTELLCSDWSNWDDAYRYVQDHNRRFEDANFTKASLVGTRQDILVIMDKRGRVAFGCSIKVSLPSGRAPLPSGLLAHIRPASLMWRGARERSASVGTLSLPGGLMFVSVHPILTSSLRGPSRGIVVMGKWLNRSAIESYCDLTHHDIRIIPLDSRPVPADIARANSALSRGTVVYTLPLSDSHLAGYSRMLDVYGKPVAILEVVARRDVYGQARKSLGWVMAALIVMGVAFGVVSSILLSINVIRPVTDLSTNVREVRTHGDISYRLPSRGTDEIAALRDDINDMLEALEIGQRRQTDLQKVYREMADLALNASDALFVWDPGAERLQWHGRVDFMLGYAENAFPRTAGAFARALEPSDRRALRELYNQTCESGDAGHLTVHIRRADRQWRVWSIRVKPSVDGTGKVVRFLGACTDVTESEQAEEEIRSSEERLARIVETNTDGIFMVGLDGMITFANAGAERIFGLTRAELLRRKHNDQAWGTRSLDGRTIRPEDTAFEEVLRTDAPVRNREGSMLHAAGHRVIITANAAPLHDSDGRIIGVVYSLSDITERKTLEERLTYQAFHDPLTNLPNRALFMDRVGKALARTNRSRVPMAVLFLDLDNFKVVNDSLGHAVGDQLLVAVSERVARCLRSGDTAARFGGDEFTVLAESIGSQAEAEAIAERIMEQLRQPFALGSREVYASPSIGIAMSTDAGETAEDLLRNSDSAMYEAKRNGKGRWEVFHPGLNAHALQRLEVENDLRRAVDRNELVVHYQPKVCLRDNSIMGFEALVRWNHPTRGLIPPAEFIPVAEQSELILDIGKWVLFEACREAVKWQREFPANPEISVSVNLSARQFKDSRLTHQVIQALEVSGLRARCLILEITESVIMDEAEETIAKLNVLKELGVRLAIDDFGTGYSSLSYLRRFPIDLVKIDRSFIEGLGRDSEDTVIVSATIGLAHALGLIVVAEGTERSDQVDRLRRMDCDVAQGYCFAKPMDSAAVHAYLANEQQQTDTLSRLLGQE